MIETHHGSTSDLINRLIGSAREPVTLVVPCLPSPEIFDRLMIVTGQFSRELRLVTSLYGSGPIATLRQIDGLARLVKMGVKVRCTDRGVLPSLFLAPPDGCCILPNDWGWGRGNFQVPIIIKGKSAGEIHSHGDRIWRRAGPVFSIRRLSTARRWLEDIAGLRRGDEESDPDKSDEVEYAELTLFDKRRGSRRKQSKRDHRAWWTFHGTSDDRVNPFLPISVWAAQHNSHKVIRFPKGRRPTGVKSGDDIFFVVLSREPGGDAVLYIVGHARAVAYRPLIDDATDSEISSDSYLARFPHSLCLEEVIFIRGVIGEGIPAYFLMNRLGAQVFESTKRNLERRSGNTDPLKSISQKAIVNLAVKGADETRKLLEDRVNLMGCVTAREIERFESG